MIVVWIFPVFENECREPPPWRIESWSSEILFQLQLNKTQFNSSFCKAVHSLTCSIILFWVYVPIILYTSAWAESLNVHTKIDQMFTVV